MKRVACIFGTRPELIKMAPVIHAMQQRNLEVHAICTGQHRELLLPLIDWFGLNVYRNLDVMAPSQTLNGLSSRLMHEFELLFKEVRYDIVIGQGDTTSVLAAALAAFHERIPFGHVEAGLRTYDMNSPFPEEMNRVLVGRLASLHFAPTAAARQNLLNEGVNDTTIFNVGNTVIDALHYTSAKLDEQGDSSTVNHKTILLTTHRRENHGQPLKNICTAIRHIAEDFKDVNVIFPVHPNPNVRAVVHERLADLNNVRLIEPAPYNELVTYLKNSYLVLTDSGGLQEEAPALGKPVLVLREETERPELIELGGGCLVGSDPKKIYESVRELLLNAGAYHAMVLGYSPYGDGKTSYRIAELVAAQLN